MKHYSFRGTLNETVSMYNRMYLDAKDIDKHDFNFFRNFFITRKSESTIVLSNPGEELVAFLDSLEFPDNQAKVGDDYRALAKIEMGVSAAAHGRANEYQRVYYIVSPHSKNKMVVATAMVDFEDGLKLKRCNWVVFGEDNRIISIKTLESRNYLALAIKLRLNLNAGI